MAIIGCWCQLIQIFSVTKCPSIQPIFLHFFFALAWEPLLGFLLNFQYILSSEYPWSASLLSFSEKEMRFVLSLLNPHCVPGLSLSFLGLYNHSLNSLPGVFSRISTKCTGDVKCWHSLCVFLSFPFPHLQSAGMNSLSPSVFTRGKFKSNQLFFWVQVAVTLAYLIFAEVVVDPKQLWAALTIVKNS